MNSSRCRDRLGFIIITGDRRRSGLCHGVYFYSSSATMFLLQVSHSDILRLDTGAHRYAFFDRPWVITPLSWKTYPIVDRRFTRSPRDLVWVASINALPRLSGTYPVFLSIRANAGISSAVICCSLELPVYRARRSTAKSISGLVAFRACVPSAT